MDGNIYVLGGYNGYTTIDSTECYSEEDDKWYYMIFSLLGTLVFTKNKILFEIKILWLSLRKLKLKVILICKLGS